MENEINSYKENICRVFLVDDDADDREFFSEALEEVNSNLGLTLFSGGEEVLNKLDFIDELPNIIFLDLYMPKMDGRECLKKIRSDARLDTVCVVMYSTYMDLEQIDELFNAGANRFLNKPSSYPALKNALDRAIESVTNNPLGGKTIINYSE